MSDGEAPLFPSKLREEWRNDGTEIPAALGRGRSELRRELVDKQAQQQVKTFTKWWNSWLVQVGVKVTDLIQDVKPGVYPIKLLEALSDSTCGKYNKKPITKFQYFENHNVFLHQLKAKSIKIVNIGAEDLAGQGSEASHRKLVLGLTWTLIQRYEIAKFGGNESELLSWAAQAAAERGASFEGSWGEAFSDGHRFCELVHDAEPSAIDLEATRQMSSPQAMQTAFDAAEMHLGVPQLLEVADFEDGGATDDKSVIL